MLRGFVDSTGVEWRVWEVIPSRAAIDTSPKTQSRTSLKSTPYANGWLCFESTEEKRRLAPIPAGWEFSGAGEMTSLLLQAIPVTARKVRDNRA